MKNASSQYLPAKWNWPRTTVQRLFKELQASGMISRIKTDLGHQTGQSARHIDGHFIVRNYETYNAARATSRANIKEVI